MKIPEHVYYIKYTHAFAAEVLKTGDAAYRCVSKPLLCKHPFLTPLSE